jgi:glycosyltransferase involved in cell wall biosynthesis
MCAAALPLVSIITPAYNGAKYVEQMLLSVLNQDYPHIEFIFMDGGSTDGTLEIVKRYEPRIHWESAPDSGQADAINQGFRRSTGEIMGWLNTDDLLTDGAISTVVDHFMQNPDVSFLYGDALAIDERNRSYGVRAHVRQTNFEELVGKGDYIVQPAAFWRRELWNQVGELDANLRYALDYEYWMRAAKHYKLRYIPVCLAKERLIRDAKTFQGGIERLEEIETVARRHGGSRMPRGFRGEAAAWYIYRGFGQLLRSTEDFKRAFAMRPGIIRFVGYFAVMVCFGPGAVPRIALQLDRILSRFTKRRITMPTGTVQSE